MNRQIITLFFITTFIPILSFANNSPIGLWTTIDDNTGKPKSIVEIKEINEQLTGTVIELLDTKKANPICTQCKGDKANQPIIGLTIIWNVKKKGSTWKGKIIDPNNGKTYRVKLTPTDEGKKLKVRGYIGNPILGRTQTWVRK